nr:hypothetical protein [Micromonospora sp. DSM 115978]
AFSVGPTAQWPEMLLVTVSTFAATLAIHHFLVRRSRLLRMLFNGKVTVGRHRASKLTIARPAVSPNGRTTSHAAHISR